ncbi:unnamed protein product [Polarella glacialis]|uniref:Uncharacterized protein n=1 Tax=Polarella glacialis TaxID=89957 RepID=A0A813H585_POLGL|nr:unnamed protein product [Polarella glacialis]CAE8740264.1 unnamed protein product [Polarella glacialis]
MSARAASHNDVQPREDASEATLRPSFIASYRMRQLLLLVGGASGAWFLRGAGGGRSVRVLGQALEALGLAEIVARGVAWPLFTMGIQGSVQNTSSSTSGGFLVQALVGLGNVILQLILRAFVLLGVSLVLGLLISCMLDHLPWGPAVSWKGVITGTLCGLGCAILLDALLVALFSTGAKISSRGNDPSLWKFQHNASLMGVLLPLLVPGSSTRSSS